MTGGEGSGWLGWRRTHSEGGWVMCAVWQRPQVKEIRKTQGRRELRFHLRDGTSGKEGLQNT